jgi:hypothetical protein
MTILVSPAGLSEDHRATQRELFERGNFYVDLLRRKIQKEDPTRLFRGDGRPELHIDNVARRRP